MSAKAMSFEDTEEITALRNKIRHLVRDELPADFRGAFVSGTAGQETADAFSRTLAEHRLLTISWPREYGGSEASVWEQTALREELWAANEPRGAQYMGLNWVGPVIMRYGTPEQKAQHLPAIAAGEEIWCQGFSEPNSGSDLASLQLDAARLDDGTWRINGQKIWTSYAELADWCFLATRTNRDGRKQEGITIFLLPMDRGGITVRPIRSIMGPHHINEVFFDQVVAKEADVLGEVDRGWDVVQTVLNHERIGIARYARSDRILAGLWDELADREAEGPGRDGPALRDAHAKALVETRIARLLSYRVVEASEEDQSSPADPNLARIATTLLDQDVAELAMEVLGPQAVEQDPAAPLQGRIEGAWRYARASTISSGTTEIQRMLVARALTRSATA
jgi:alkylation response protein AidB-like acyl-CoA dehydrogenase